MDGLHGTRYAAAGRATERGTRDAGANRGHVGAIPRERLPGGGARGRAGHPRRVARPMKSVTHVGAADLLALAGQPPRITLEEAARAAHELYDLEGTLTALEGERDCNFCLRSRDGRQFVLKFIDPQADEVIVAGQSAALTHLAEQAPHLPVPRGIATGAGQMTGLMSTGAGTCRVRLVNYLPGRPFTAAPAHGLMRHAGVVIAELNRALRGFSHPALGQPLAWDIRRAGVLREAVGHV